MVNLAASLGDSILVLVAGAIFLLVFAIILEVLRKVSLFNKTNTTLVALCVSLLCIIGLQRFLLPGSDGHELSDNGGGSGTGFDLILLPYAALAIAILVMSLLLFLSRIFRKRSKKRHYREFYRGVEKRYPFGSASEAGEKPNGKSHIRK